jgi:Stress responsive A/B Barrel Domain
MTAISHLVLMKPRPGLSPADRDALVAAFERAAREIPSIRGIRVGRRITHGAGYEQPDAADYLAVIDFDDLACRHTSGILRTTSSARVSGCRSVRRWCWTSRWAGSRRYAAAGFFSGDRRCASRYAVC